MRKLALIAGAVVVAVGAVFAVGLFVGHWFGFGEEAWSPVTLPQAEAEARVGPLSELPPVVEAEEALESAQQALADAEAAAPSLGGMPEPWQGPWCLERARGELMSRARSAVLTAPASPSYADWREWAAGHEQDFHALCAAVLADASPSLTNEEKAGIQERAWRALVAEARSGVAWAEQHLAETRRSYRSAVDAAVATIVEESASSARGAETADAIRAGLLDAEWVFCDTNGDEVMAATVSLGFLPDNPSDDLFTFWWVTRPDEYIRACKAAYALR